MNARWHDGLSPSTWGLIFNVFRRRGSDLACAVPLDRPVPPFVDARWSYVCAADAACRMPGLDYASLSARVARNGVGFFRTGLRATDGGSPDMLEALRAPHAGTT